MLTKQVFGKSCNKCVVCFASETGIFETIMFCAKLVKTKVEQQEAFACFRRISLCFCQPSLEGPVISHQFMIVYT